MTSRTVTTEHGIGRRVAQLAAGLCLAGGALAVALPTASASSADTSQCGTGSSGGDVSTCLTVTNDSVSATVRAISQGRELSTCIHHNGSTGDCTGFSYVAPGQTIGEANDYVGGATPNGTWCAVTWEQGPNGGTTEIASECIGTGTVTIS